MKNATSLLVAFFFMQPEREFWIFANLGFNEEVLSSQR